MINQTKTHTAALPLPHPGLMTAPGAAHLVALDYIDTAPQIRGEMDPDGLAELAESIEQRGCCNPCCCAQVAGPTPTTRPGDLS